MKIERVDLFQLEVPIVHVYETSYGRIDRAHPLILKFYTPDFTLFTECAAGAVKGFSYETIGTAREVLKGELLPAIIGRNVHDPAEFWQWCGHLRGHPMAKASVENAFWIIKALEEGKSLAALLGNEKERLVAGAGIGIQASPEALVGMADHYLAQGYTKIKIKIKPGRDLAYVAALRKAHPDVPLMVDANNAYTLDDIETLQTLDTFDLLMIEQPLGYDDIFEHAKLQARLKTPIGLDESIQGPYFARIAIEMNACGCINIKQCRMAGLARSCEVHDICQDAGIGVWCGGMLETGIGRAVLLALSGLPNFVYPMDIGASNKHFFQDIVSPEIKLNADGTISVPSAPGLGVEVDEKQLDRFTVARDIIRGRG
jgi:o-succinylbenzoate synthase